MLWNLYLQAANWAVGAVEGNEWGIEGGDKRGWREMTNTELEISGYKSRKDFPQEVAAFSSAI